MTNPAFVVYAMSAVVLCLNLLVLWGYSGSVRVKEKSVVNQEDAPGVAVLQADAPEVARVLRAHRNAEASIYPFLVLALVVVLAGGGALFMKIVCGVFVVARIAHSIAYLRAKQPWRTIFFILGGICIGALIVDIVLLLLQGR